MFERIHAAPFCRETWWTPRRRLFALAAVMAVLIRLVLGLKISGNYDTGSYWIVAQLLDAGQSVYAGTDRYNYGPWWGWIVWCLWKIAHPFNSAYVFHFCISALLTGVDLTLAYILARRYKPEAAIFFLLCPVSILITGVHGQFDNLAVLVGFCGWLLIQPDDTEVSLGRLMAGAIVLGLSISIKHILVFFPLWILLCPRFGSWGRRLGFVGVAYLVFALGFAPWLADPASRDGIVKNVLLYRGAGGVGIMRPLVDLVVPLEYAANEVPGLVAYVPMACWCLALVGIGWWVGGRVGGGAVLRRLRALGFRSQWDRPQCSVGLRSGRSATDEPGRVEPGASSDLFLIYLLVMVGLSPAMADQYLAIPLLACAVAYRSWPVWVYTWVATIHLLYSRHNLNLLGWRVPMFYQAQLWLLVLLVIWPGLWRRQAEGSALADGDVDPRQRIPAVGQVTA